MSTKPALAELLRRSLEAHTYDLRVCLPGRIESYDAAKCKASVQILIQNGYLTEGGERVAETLPILHEVPVLLPGSGGVRIRFPISPGDTCLVLFSSASLDLWLTRGGLVDPLDDRRHDINDAVVIPGLMAFSQVAENTPQIDITSAEIKAGGSSALATKADIDALKSWIQTHTHSGVTSGGGTSGPPIGAPPTAAGTAVLKGS